MLRRFRTQLTMTITLIVLITVSLISLFANIFINIEFKKYAENQQQIRTKDITSILSHQFNDLTGKWDTSFIHGVGMAAMYDGFIIHIVDLNGEIIWDAENHDMETCSQVMMEIIERMEQKRPGLNGEFISQEYDLEKNYNKIGTVIINYYSPYFLSESDLHFWDSLNFVLVFIGSLSLIFSLVAGGFLAKRISRPVIKTAHIATQIAEGNYKIRFEGDLKTQELEELITAVNHMAQSLDRQESLRKRLTTDVAHELRTPLSAIASHLEAMIDGVWEPTYERLQSCYEEISRISGLVVDLEKLAQVENENLILEKFPVDLLTLVNQVASNFESESLKKRITLTTGGKSSVVPADKDRLIQVLSNLLSNALKYTPENGTVLITVHDTLETGIITVTDNGIGIPNDELPLIFERFYRTDKSRNRKTGGAGIGLTVAKTIVTAHGGKLEAKSETGSGSIFTIILPKNQSSIN